MARSKTYWALVRGHEEELHVNTILTQSTLVISASLISNNHLSRSENLVHILTWKANNKQFLLFSTIFSIYLTSGVTNLLNVVVRVFHFFWILQIWYVEVRISRSIPESPLDFEITRVNCVSIVLVPNLHPTFKSCKKMKKNVWRAKRFPDSFSEAS